MLAMFRTLLPRLGSRRSTINSATDFIPSFDPYTYTRGRWLDRDAERQKAREIRFDFDALLSLAIKCSPGANRVVDCKKKEGGFNRVFMILFDNGRTVVARLPTRSAGPVGLTVSSEVATLQFARDRTNIPVPSVLSWSADKDNALRAEYIIMDEMPGVALSEVWNTMTASQHIRCIQALGLLCTQLWKISFPSYGSLYLNTHSPPNFMPLDDTFNIGPVCTAHHWDNENPRVANANTFSDLLGPWNSFEKYLSALLAQAESLGPSNNDKYGIEVLNSTQARSALAETIQKSTKVIIDAVAVRNASEPTLFHPDFHTRNILVSPEDPTKITGIIDWQSATIEPSFMLNAETPDFARELPRTEGSSENASSVPAELSPQSKIRVDTEFCAKAWAVMLQICPKSRAAYDLDPSLINFLAAGSVGWLKDTVTMRLILLEISQKWDELGLPGQSFYQPSDEELLAIKSQEEAAKTAVCLTEHLVHLLGCDTDGWVAAEKWNEVLPIYREEYQRFVECYLYEKENASKETAVLLREADQLWPFDQR